MAGGTSAIPTMKQLGVITTNDDSDFKVQTAEIPSAPVQSGRDIDHKCRSGV